MKLSAAWIACIAVGQLEGSVGFDPGHTQHVPENLKWPSSTARQGVVDPKHLVDFVSPDRGLSPGNPGSPWWTIHSLSRLLLLRAAGPFHCSVVFLNC